MSDKHFSLIFRGDIVFGENILAVKQKVKALFKASDAQLERLFCGKPIALKTNLNQAQATKYQAVLKQAGIIVSLEPHTQKTPATKIPSKTSDAQWQLKPRGSLLQDAKADPVVKPIATDHIDVAAQSGYLLKDSERPPEETSKIDMDALNWDLSREGETLLKASEKHASVKANIDTSALSVSEQNGELLQAHEKAKISPININTDHLTLANNTLGNITQH